MAQYMLIFASALIIVMGSTPFVRRAAVRWGFIDPHLARAHSTLGLIYFHLGRLDEAVEENLKVLEVFPDDFIQATQLLIEQREIAVADEIVREDFQHL